MKGRQFQLREPSRAAACVGGSELKVGGREGGPETHPSQPETNDAQPVATFPKPQRTERPLSARVQICHLNILRPGSTRLSNLTQVPHPPCQPGHRGEVNHGAARVCHARNCRWVLGTWSWYSKRAGLGGMYGLAGGQGGRGGVLHIPVIPPADPHQSKPLILTTEVRIRPSIIE